jgi:Family of unknown function (DUF6801)
MSRLRVLAVLSVLAAGATVVTAAVPTPSRAASRVLTYHCESSALPVQQDEGLVTASWDTPVREDLVVDVGEKIHLMPLTGEITLPAGFVDRLRAAGFTDLSGEGGATIAVTETGAEIPPVLVLPADPLPESGPAALHVSGVLDSTMSGMTDPVAFDEPGTHTLVLVHFGLLFGSGSDQPQPGLICGLQDIENTAMDRFLVRAPAQPSEAATPQTEPTRPVVVQTDFAAESPTSALPLVLGGLVLAAAVGRLTTWRARARAGTREH